MTKYVCEKIAQSVAPKNFSPKLKLNDIRGKSSPNNPAEKNNRQ
jgi:hypothetical protein